MALPNGSTPSGNSGLPPFRVVTNGSNMLLSGQVTEVYGETINVCASEYQKNGIPPTGKVSPPDFMNGCSNVAFFGGKFITAGRKITITSDPQPTSASGSAPTPSQTQAASRSPYLWAQPSAIPTQVHPPRTRGLDEDIPQASNSQNIPDPQTDTNDATSYPSPSSSVETIMLPERGSGNACRSWQHRQGAYRPVAPNSKGLAMWKATEDMKAYGINTFLPRK